MHILRRTSFSESISQALAWHTTSRSLGLRKSERSQNVSGSGAKPREVKKPSRSLGLRKSERSQNVSGRWAKKREVKKPSRSLGLRKSERSQNVSGSGAKPREVKKPSPYLTICFQSVLRFLSSAVRSLSGSALAGAISG